MTTEEQLTQITKLMEQVLIELKELNGNVKAVEQAVKTYASF